MANIITRFTTQENDRIRALCKIFDIFEDAIEKLSSNERKIWISELEHRSGDCGKYCPDSVTKCD